MYICNECITEFYLPITEIVELVKKPKNENEIKELYLCPNCGSTDIIDKDE